MRLGLALATVRFDAFPREDFVALRALRRVVTRFLCSTFDRFFNLAMIGASQCRRRSQAQRRWCAWHGRHYQDDAANEAAEPLSRFAAQRRLHADGLRRPYPR